MHFDWETVDTKGTFRQSILIGGVLRGACGVLNTLQDTRNPQHKTLN